MDAPWRQAMDDLRDFLESLTAEERQALTADPDIEVRFTDLYRTLLPVLRAHQYDLALTSSDRRILQAITKRVEQAQRH